MVDKVNDIPEEISCQLNRNIQLRTANPKQQKSFPQRRKLRFVKLYLLKAFRTAVPVQEMDKVR
jgi:hypothetical protein